MLLSSEKSSCTDESTYCTVSNPDFQAQTNKCVNYLTIMFLLHYFRRRLEIACIAQGHVLKVMWFDQNVNVGSARRFWVLPVPIIRCQLKIFALNKTFFNN